MAFANDEEKEEEVVFLQPKLANNESSQQPNSSRNRLSPPGDEVTSSRNHQFHPNKKGKKKKKPSSQAFSALTIQDRKHSTGKQSALSSTNVNPAKISSPTRTDNRGSKFTTRHNSKSQVFSNLRPSQATSAIQEKTQEVEMHLKQLSRERKNKTMRIHSKSPSLGRPISHSEAVSTGAPPSN